MKSGQPSDLERSSPLLVFSGLVHSVGFVLTTTWLVTTAVTGFYSGWIPLRMSIAVAVICGLVIYGNQFVLLGKWAWAGTVGRLLSPAPART